MSVRKTDRRFKRRYILRSTQLLAPPLLVAWIVAWIILDAVLRGRRRSRVASPRMPEGWRSPRSSFHGVSDVTWAGS